MRAMIAGLALPLAEIAVLILIGGWIGVWPVLGLIVLAVVAGLLLMRTAGMAAPRELQAAMARRENPAPALVRATLRLIAGGLLIIPGFLTDIMALILLLPGIDRLVVDRIGLRVMAGRPLAPVVDGEFVDLTETPGPSGWTRDQPGIESGDKR
jgi:UPF0716 protein FxsA